MKQTNCFFDFPKAQGLYDPAFEHDACGVGFVASVHGEPSRKIVTTALACVCNLMHRGALDADEKSGDGAGVVTQIPHKFFRAEIEKMGKSLYRNEDLGIGVFFLPAQNIYAQARCRQLAEEALARRGLIVLGWRVVPINPRVVGGKAALSTPRIEQVLVVRPDSQLMDDDAFERTLFLCRNEVEDQAAHDKITDLYIPSMSSRSIIYKGMLTGPQIERFYPDLQSELYESAFVVFHQRYSTNTFPTWRLAHPFRMLAHNGEINTVRGNRNWVKAREADLQSPLWGKDIDCLKPIIQDGGSDSASLDNALEMLCMSGRSLLHSIMMLVPAAWKAEVDLPPAVRAFYEYHDGFSEPWDGPAALVITDGKTVAACLDRNGLRPSRYKITQDGLMILGSEAGIGNIPDAQVVEKGRLSPGEIIAIDTIAGKLFRNNEIKALVAQEQPYAQWVAEGVLDLASLSNSNGVPRSLSQELSPEAFKTLAASFGYNEEETKIILLPMASKGEEPVGSMGDDAALAVLSRQPHLLYDYFRQLFAQVTNPPMDPIREKLVMSTTVHCGQKRNWLEETAEHAHLLRLPSPFLLNEELAAIRALQQSSLKHKDIFILFSVADGVNGFEKCLQSICQQAEEAIDVGFTLLILSDRGTNAETAALPMLLAVSAVHHHLIRVGKRMRGSILAETAEARNIHHIASLVGFGAAAVNPYLACEFLVNLKNDAAFNGMDEKAILTNYRSAIDKGLLKVMSRMGISLLSSYQGGQIFEAIGLSKELVQKHFTNTTSFIGGIGIKELAEETLLRHTNAYLGKSLSDPGTYRFRRDGEAHAITPPVIQNLHSFSGFKGADKAGKIEEYQKFVESVYGSNPITIRHLLKLKKSNKPVSLDEVEPIEDIRRRFTTAGMSLGALSPEAHEDLAIAMNRIGGKSNSGEGGEDKARFTPMENGDSKNSAIKQIASGRFGVTAEYLASAAEIEIKMAQGAKPGEGGQLPAHKVSALIAKLRRSTPGVMLISPPPHHDIYSIEDLAQLIYDLKQVNPRAKVCVKLVAEAGVGTVAAGVAKAHADVVLVSGHDGGTGASPLSSIKYAGSPWELGVAETQQVLLLNGLRDRITVRTDGGMRTGLDIVMAALLGAEEFNFGTAALISLGCVYVRQCHLNNCPTGIATQDDKYRAKYKGKPENLVQYLNAVAEEVREILASLGVRTLNEIIGHTEFLEQIEIPNHPKANTLDLSPLLISPDVDDMTRRYHVWERNDKHEDTPLDRNILQDVKSTLQTKKPIHLTYKIKNVHRSIATQLSGAIAYRYGDEGLPEDSINLKLIGSAGQSLGAFLVKGIRLELIGEANDYVGKGISGGKMILKPDPTATFSPSENVICGNTVLYGAIGGQFFAYGRAGERFAVRNSGATAVIEGVGDHGCEYMTGGTVVVLGKTGKNFAAGMSGGLAYVLDEENAFEKRVNKSMVELERLQGNEESLRNLIALHAAETGSTKAKEIVENWEKYLSFFWKIVPHPPVAMVIPPSNLVEAKT